MSGYLGLVGVPSCGCLGATKANPWWMFGIDATAILLLLIWRQPWTGFGGRLRAGLGGTLPLVGTAGVVTVLALTAFNRLAPVADGLTARVRGDSLTVRPTTADVGSGMSGERRETTVEVMNWSAAPVTVYGGTTGCGYDILAD